MAVTYTTAALVRKRVENIDASLLDSDIEQYIYEAEGVVDACMKDSLKMSFDSSKHGLIQACATDLAAYYCICFNPSAHPTLSDAELIANLLFNSSERNLSLLTDPRIVDYLKGL